MLIDCIQRDGQHIPVEEWVYNGVINGVIKDPVLVRIVKGATKFRPFGWPLREWEK